MRIIFFYIFAFLLTCNTVISQKKSDNSFLLAKGTLSYPIKKVIEIDNLGKRKLVCDGDIWSKVLILYSDSSYEVQSIWDCIVQKVAQIEDSYIIITRSGKYYITYSGVTKPHVKDGQVIKKGQLLSYLAMDYNDKYRVEIYFSYLKKDIDPYEWFKQSLN